MDAENVSIAVAGFFSKILAGLAIMLWIPAEILFGRMACSIARNKVMEFFKEK